MRSEVCQKCFKMVINTVDTYKAFVFPQMSLNGYISSLKKKIYFYLLLKLSTSHQYIGGFTAFSVN